jgi:organic radical activating enzyme
MKKLRVQMMNHTPPEDHCRSCINAKFTNSVIPQSFHHNVKGVAHIDEMIEKTAPDGYTTYQPRTIDIRTDLCNLKCRICGPASSTSIRKEMKSFNLNLIDRHPQIDAGISDEMIQNVEHITWAGGEPFMSPMHWDIMDRLVKCGNTNVIIWYNTNLTFPGKTLDRAVELLKQFPNVSMGASLDSVGDDAEYIRDGLNYAEFLENLKIMEPLTYLNISFTATSMGLLSLDKMIQLCLDTDTHFNCTTVKLDFKPDHCLLVNVLKKEVLDKCLDDGIAVAKGTRLEQIVNDYCLFVRSKYIPVVPDLESNRFNESMRGKLGYFDKRMKGLINE